jgi:hypothetical protein
MVEDKISVCSTEHELNLEVIYLQYETQLGGGGMKMQQK